MVAVVCSLLLRLILPLHLLLSPIILVPVIAQDEIILEGHTRPQFHHNPLRTFRRDPPPCLLPHGVSPN
jgi:hypothetical protein